MNSSIIIKKKFNFKKPEVEEIKEGSEEQKEVVSPSRVMISFRPNIQSVSNEFKEPSEEKKSSEEKKLDIKTDNVILLQKSILSKNSIVARSGFHAEDLLCRSQTILESLGSNYFKKNIITCKKISKNKKSDVIFTFDDGTITTAQLKNGTGGGRGWSFDRRSVDLMPTTDSGKELMRIVCLKQPGERKVVEKDEGLIKTLIFGNDDATKPEHFIHTEVKDGHIVNLSVCPASEFIDILLKDSYDIFNAKKTCIYLTPIIYLQRKGGGKADHSPNDIQAKLRHMPDCMKTIPFI